MALLEHIQMAIGTHMRWKERLVQAVETGKSKWTVEGIRQDDQCALGMWLNGPDFLDDDSCNNHAQVTELHRQFHLSAAKVLGNALAGDAATAETLMQGEYAELSDALVGHLNEWKKDARKPLVAAQ